MPWTPLHAALGENTTALTFEMLERAVDQRVEETAQLDWKDRLPLSTNSDQPTTEEKQAKAEELAKDVAAMANSGGGLIVYGMDEEANDGREAASLIIPIGEVTSDTERDIRAAANNLIYPPVSGVEFFRLHPDGQPLEGVLALLVPDSQDAPHLVHPKKSKDWFQAPWRDGPHTRFMGERQLADAYRRREQGRREHDAELGETFEHFLEGVGATQGEDSAIWVVGVARPLRPLDDYRRFPPRGAERVAAKARNFPWMENEMTPLAEATKGEVRRGYRMHHLTHERAASHLIEGASSRRIGARAEVHGDGTLAVGVTRDGMLGSEVADPGHVPWRDLELVGLDLLAMLLVMQRSGGPKCDYEMLIGLSRQTETFRAKEPEGFHYAPFKEESRVRGFRPIRGLVTTQLGRRELIESACVVIDDAVSQTGASMIHHAQWLDTQLWLEED